MKESEIKYPDILEQFDLHPKLKSCKYDWSDMVKRHFLDGEAIAEIAKSMGCHRTVVATVIMYAEIGKKRKAKQDRKMKIKDVLERVEKELLDAFEKHRSFNSPHEGIAIIQEETDELWEAIRKLKSFDGRNEDMIHEATQIAAMAVRFLIDFS